MAQLIAKAQSDTDADTLYTIVRTDTGRLVCDCPAYRLQKHTGANGLDCKHLTRTRQELERPGVKVPLRVGSPFWSRRNPKDIWRKGSEVKPAIIEKIATGQPILDEFLGGGVAKGHTTLISGGPGCGKSLLCGLISSLLSEAGKMVLYAVGEEPSENYLARLRHYGWRFDERIMVGDTQFIGDLESGVEKYRPELMVVDSLQAHGFGPNQMRTPLVEQNILQRLIKLAQVRNLAVIVICHQTKSGDVKGGNTLQHDADAVIKIAKDPDMPQERVACVEKNRSGPNGVTIRYILSKTEFKIMEDPLAALGAEFSRLDRQMRGSLKEAA